jgi:hypothetical protein
MLYDVVANQRLTGDRSVNPPLLCSSTTTANFGVSNGARVKRRYVVHTLTLIKLELCSPRQSSPPAPTNALCLSVRAVLPCWHQLLGRNSAMLESQVSCAGRRIFI